MAEKSIKNWKSLLVFPGIVRCSDKGCLKKIIFPVVITTLKGFRSALFERGKLFQGLSPWPAEFFLLWGFWRGGAVFFQTILYASGRGPGLSLSYSGTNINKLMQCHQVTPRLSPATLLLTLPMFYLRVHDLCCFSFKPWLWESH